MDRPSRVRPKRRIPLGAFDLSHTYVHLGLGATAVPLPDFRWDDEYLEQYLADHATDGDEGRLVIVSGSESPWTFWERHPAGDEVAVLLSGCLTFIQEGGEHRIKLRPGQAAITPRGTWHTADVEEASTLLFITPGRGTEHRPR